MLAVHRAAVRGTAAFYGPDTIEDWAPLPLPPHDVEGLAAAS